MAKKAKKIELVKWGFAQGRPDLERIGLFAEMPYMNGKGYVSPFTKDKEYKKCFISPGPKILVGLQDALFEKEFKRIFENEAIVRGSKKPPVKNISTRPFISACGSKLHATPGDYYGCFSGIISEFSPKTRPLTKDQQKKEGRIFLTNPGKKGGPGYIDITIGKYPAYMWSKYGAKPKFKEYGTNLGGPMRTMVCPRPYFDPNPYPDPPNVKPGKTYIRPKEKEYGKVRGHGIFMPTGPAKWLGGMKAGCFDKWPEHHSEPYKTLYQVLKPKKESKIFYPQSMGAKSFYYTSILEQNNSFRINKSNYLDFKPTYVKYMTTHS